jgi:hypothetical protein
MSDEFDPFDVKNLKTPELEAAEAALRADMNARKREGRSKLPKHSEKRFTKFPGIWEEALAKVHASGSAYAVAIVLLYEAWKQVSQGRASTVKLTNVMLARSGVGRKGKAIALRTLRAAGLVTVEERPRKSPIVTVRFVG